MAQIEVVRPRFEVGDIVRDHGEAFRRTRRLSLAQLKAMSAIGCSCGAGDERLSHG